MAIEKRVVTWHTLTYLLLKLNLYLSENKGLQNGRLQGHCNEGTQILPLVLSRHHTPFILKKAKRNRKILHLGFFL